MDTMAAAFLRFVDEGENGAVMTVSPNDGVVYKQFDT
jgi:hypothetical protein